LKEKEIESFKDLMKKVERHNIKDSSVFDLQKPINSDLEYRRPQIEHLMSPIVEFVKGGIREHVFLYGPVGSGKSAAAIYYFGEVFQHLCKGVDVHYVNCRHKHSTYHILKHLTQTEKKSDRETLKDRFKGALLKNKDRKKIIILDECDNVKDNNFLYTIAREPEFKSVVLLIITKDAGYYNRISDDVKSSLNHRYLSFPCYNVDEIEKILLKRAEKGLMTFWKGNITSIAAMTYNEFESDVRVGLRALPKIYGRNSELPDDWIKDLKHIMDGALAEIEEQNLLSIPKLKFQILHIVYTSRGTTTAAMEKVFTNKTQKSGSRFRQIVSELLSSAYIRKESITKGKKVVNTLQLNLDPKTIQKFETIAKSRNIW